MLYSSDTDQRTTRRISSPGTVEPVVMVEGVVPTVIVMAEVVVPMVTVEAGTTAML